jgi:HK97 gp10 family phage protein
MQNKILRKAVGDASKIVLKTAKQKVPKGETGLLKKSLGRKISVNRRTGRVVAIVGPRTGYKSTKKGKKITKLGEQFKAAEVNPVRYAHLVEKGTKHSAPKPFLRPALDNNLSQIKATMAQVIKDGLEKNQIGSVPSEGMQND